MTLSGWSGDTIRFPWGNDTTIAANNHHARITTCWTFSNRCWCSCDTSTIGEEEKEREMCPVYSDTEIGGISNSIGRRWSRSCEPGSCARKVSFLSIAVWFKCQLKFCVYFHFYSVWVINRYVQLDRLQRLRPRFWFILLLLLLNVQSISFVSHTHTHFSSLPRRKEKLYVYRKPREARICLSVSSHTHTHQGNYSNDCRTENDIIFFYLFQVVGGLIVVSFASFF